MFQETATSENNHDLTMFWAVQLHVLKNEMNCKGQVNQLMGFWTSYNSWYIELFFSPDFAIVTFGRNSGRFHDIC